MAESMAMFAPNANSYRRFVSESYAPMSPIWGINNRSVSLRVPAGPAASRHVEHRVAGADANLYLAVAAVLAAAEHGIAHELDPGPPVEGNGYAQAGDRALPGSWRRALMVAERGSFLRAALGEEFMEIFLAIKLQECARFSAEVSELDYAWYLRS
jgi:glutamine synthetase